jgi:periodic tryptophan protein 2
MVHDSTVAAYSPNGSTVATGSHEGKVRLWDRNSGFCFATFDEHEASVTAIEFSNQTTLFSCSLDGTVNAYDANKYKKFRTFKPDTKCQLICMAIEPTG